MELGQQPSPPIIKEANKHNCSCKTKGFVSRNFGGSESGPVVLCFVYKTVSFICVSVFSLLISIINVHCVLT